MPHDPETTLDSDKLHSHDAWRNPESSQGTQVPLLGADVSAVETRISRPIHYLGSKLRVVDSIRRSIDTVSQEHSPVCDLFAGSGTVSVALSPTRDVTAVDIQEYSRVLCSAVLEPADISGDDVDDALRKARGESLFGRLAWAFAPLIEHERRCIELARSGDNEPLCDLMEHGCVLGLQSGNPAPSDLELCRSLRSTIERLEQEGLASGPESVVSRYYGGVYFSYHQAVQLDSVASTAFDAAKGKRDCLIAAVLSSASDVVNTVGKQFAQPIRPRDAGGTPKRHLLSHIERDRWLDVFSSFESWLRRYASLPRSGRKHRAVRSDYRDFLKSEPKDVGVFYADPPYTRDHYSRYYHLLETLCLRDVPSVSSVRIGGRTLMSRGVYRSQRHQSPFCIKTQAPGAFSELFEGVRRLNAPLVLSYSPYDKAGRARPRLMAVGDVVLQARRIFRRVEVISAGRIAHNKLNASTHNTAVSYDAEVLIICEP